MKTKKILSSVMAFLMLSVTLVTFNACSSEDAAVIKKEQTISELAAKKAYLVGIKWFLATTKITEKYRPTIFFNNDLNQKTRLRTGVATHGCFKMTFNYVYSLGSLKISNPFYTLCGTRDEVMVGHSYFKSLLLSKRITLTRNGDSMKLNIFNTYTSATPFATFNADIYSPLK